MEEIDRELLATIVTDVLRPELVTRVIQSAREMFEASSRPDSAEILRRQIESVERTIARLTEAMSSEPVGALIQKLNAAQRQRRELLARPGCAGKKPAWDDLERRIRRNLDASRARFQAGTAEARQGFRELLTTPIVFTPCASVAIRRFGSPDAWVWKGSSDRSW